MFAEVPMQFPTQEGKLWGHYEENCEKGFLQDIIEHFDKNGEAVIIFRILFLVTFTLIHVPIVRNVIWQNNWS